MTLLIGSTRNTNDEATTTKITINPNTAVVIAPANPDRIYFYVALDPDDDDVVAFVRLYPAAEDNIKQGTVLVRRLSANDSIVMNDWIMAEGSVYTGELSAISFEGTYDLVVVEY